MINGCIKFLADIFTRWFHSRQLHNNSKDLERHKKNLEKKVYVSKIKFDIEMEIHRELSKTFFDLIKDFERLIPTSLEPRITEHNEQEIRKEQGEASRVTLQKSSDTLYSNAPFIPKECFDKYEEIYTLCNEQLTVFQFAWFDCYINQRGQRMSFTREDYDRTKAIITKWKQLSNFIRDYFSQLEIIS